MNNRLCKPIALLLVLCLLSASFPAALAAGSPAAAAEPKPSQELTEPPLTGFHHLELPGYHLPAEEKTGGNRAPLPASFNAAAQGWVTPVKNQQPYGTCWAFGTLSPIESYMIKHRIPVGSTGTAADTDLDLSEYHLSYFSYTNAYDELGLTAGDSSILADSHLNIGGDGYKSTLTLMRWEGPASEEIPELAYNQADPTETIDPKYAYAYNVAHVSDVDWINTSDRDAVKQAIMEYGSGFFGYCWMQAYNSTNGSGAYCYIQNDYTNGANHAVTLVGWDDNYSKENFNYLPASSRPQNNGAWIVKNSWGASGSLAAYTDDGYNYISYEDTASYNETCMFYKAEPVDNYQHIYQYDGTLNIDDYVGLMQNHSKVANVFTSQGHEKVEAVSILTLEEGLGYTLDIYKGLTIDTDPTSGTLVSTQTGTIAYHGYHSITLEAPVSVDAGEKFSVVFTLHSNQPSDSLMMVVPVDASRTDNYETTTLTHTHAIHMNTSFFQLAGTGGWSQPKEGTGNFRIKAYTSDDPYALSAVSEDENKGTVTVGGHTARGWKVTATPAEGYYASGCTVTVGDAAVEQEGGVFYIEPTVDSSVTIHFAAKFPVTVTYMANEETVGTASGVTGEALTLPETAPVFENCTFLGWTPTQTQSSMTQPQTYAPGSVYYPLGNDTLYALYYFRHQAVPGQDGSYVKITSTAELTDGKYLIVNESRQLALNGALIDSAIDVLDNEMAVTVNGDRIPENETVNDGAFTYDAATRSLGGKRESSSGKVYYIGAPGNPNTGRHYIYTTPYQTSAGLIFTFNSDGSVKIADDYYTAWSLQYYDDGSESNFRFTKTSENVYPISLYRKTENTTSNFYTTDIDAEPIVSYVVSFNSNGGSHVPDQTVAAGQTVVKPDDPTKDSFDFAGWYSDSGLTQAYDFSTPVNSGFTLHAKWMEATPKTYTVTFNSNGGSAVPPQTIVDGGTVVKPEDPTKDGFSFAGWFVDSGLVNLYDFGMPVHGNFNLFAKWEEAAPPHTHTPGEAVTENETAPSCTEAGSYDSVVYCVTCGAELSRETVSLDPLGHDWDEGVVTLEPTENEDGQRLYTCERCGATRTEVIPRLDQVNPFVDVTYGKYYYEPVMWAFYHEPQITCGTDETHFSPSAPCTREQIVFFLWAAQGKPAPFTNSTSFIDIKPNKYYYEAVLWAQENGITNGIRETLFGVGSYCTRDQVVTFLWRAAASPEPQGATQPFRDVPADAYYAKAVRWAVENGVTGGSSANTFSPQKICTRAEAVTFLYRFDELLAQ
jgi:uncharacterized repeat protein (TIGR02543 family)